MKLSLLFFVFVIIITACKESAREPVGPSDDSQPQQFTRIDTVKKCIALDSITLATFRSRHESNRNIVHSIDNVLSGDTMLFIMYVSGTRASSEQVPYYHFGWQVDVLGIWYSFEILPNDTTYTPAKNHSEYTPLVFLDSMKIQKSITIKIYVLPDSTMDL